MKLSAKQVIAVAEGAGFSPLEARVMATIAFFESGWETTVINNNPRTGDLSYGLWQINMIGRLGPERRRLFGISSNEQLLDPQTNARAAYILQRGRGNYEDWSVWKSRETNPNWDAKYREVTQTKDLKAGFSIPLPPFSGLDILRGGDSTKDFLGGAGDIAGGIYNNTFGKFIEWLMTPNGEGVSPGLRIAMFIGGGVLIIISAVALTRATGIKVAAPVAKAVLASKTKGATA